MSDDKPEKVKGGDDDPVEARGRGVYLLPNLFTTAALFAGFYSVVSSHNGNFSGAAIAILFAMVLDGLDGRVARLTNTASDFGAEYDSMSDMVSFGVAPGFLIYAWSLSSMSIDDYGYLGWVCAFFYTACCGLRLARFNVQLGKTDKRFFQGLACPSAAALIACVVWVTHELGVPGRETEFLSVFVTLMCGLLMVSNFTYYSFKEIKASRRIPFFVTMVLVLGVVFVSFDPPKVLLTGFTIYALSGPAYAGFRWIRKRNRSPSVK